MATPKLTWKYYSARRRGLSVEKYIETNKIESLDALRKHLKDKDVQMPEPELLKELFVPAWTGKYPDKAEDSLRGEGKKRKPQQSKSKEAGNAKAKRTKKRSKQPSEAKSTYLQAAYEDGSRDDESNADSGA